MKKIAMSLIILAGCIGAFYLYTQYASQSVIVIDQNDGEASKVKINLNVKDDKKEEIKKEEEKPIEKLEEEIKPQPVEDLKEIDSGDVALPKKIYSDFEILK